MKMKRNKLVLFTALCSLSLGAQPGTVYTRTAGNPDGKILTMEETILS
ncbi:secreted protein, partial [gut metagenome]